MNFKTFTLIVGLAVASILSVTKSLAVLPTYGTGSAYGNTSSNASYVIPPNPNSQIRLVTVYYTSDNAAGGLSLSTGTTAYANVFTNTSATSLTNFVGSTNGLTVGAVICLQHNGGNCYTNTIASYGNTGTFGWTNANGVVLTNSVQTYGALQMGAIGAPSTNVSYIVTGAGGFGVIASVGDNIWQMSSPTTIIVGLGTNELAGDDIYSGNYGCPVAVWLGPVTATNRLSTISWHYDSQSQ